jgi:hypothetical protein
MAKGIFYLKGLRREERKKVKDLTIDLLSRNLENPLFLSQPARFVYCGIDTLTELVFESEFANPRIEGSLNGNRHYWLAFDIGEESLVIDFFFKYVGLEKYARDVLSKKQAKCYESKRIIPDEEELEDEVIKLESIRKKIKGFERN